MVPAAPARFSDHELLAERLAHVLGEQARQDVVAAPAANGTTMVTGRVG